MEKNIATINSEKLASLSFLFCLTNGLEVTQELSDAMAMTIILTIAKWYNDRGMAFNPETDLITDEAISYAFAEMQELTDGARFVARVCAETGIGLE